MKIVSKERSVEFCKSEICYNLVGLLLPGGLLRRYELYRILQVTSPMSSQSQLRLGISAENFVIVGFHVILIRRIRSQFGQ